MMRRFPFGLLLVHPSRRLRHLVLLSCISIRTCCCLLVCALKSCMTAQPSAADTVISRGFKSVLPLLLDIDRGNKLLNRIPRATDYARAIWSLLLTALTNGRLRVNSTMRHSKHLRQSSTSWRDRADLKRGWIRSYGFNQP